MAEWSCLQVTSPGLVGSIPTCCATVTLTKTHLAMSKPTCLAESLLCPATLLADMPCREYSLFKLGLV